MSLVIYFIVVLYYPNIFMRLFFVGLGSPIFAILFLGKSPGFITVDAAFILVRPLTTGCHI